MHERILPVINECLGNMPGIRRLQDYHRSRSVSVRRGLLGFVLARSTQPGIHSLCPLASCAVGVQPVFEAYRALPAMLRTSRLTY